MTVESDADRLTMLTDHGEQVEFSPGNVWPNRAGDHATVWIIFDAEYIEIITEHRALNSSQPLAIGRTSDLAGAVRGSMLERSGTGKDYKIVNVEPDGTGITLLELEGPR